MKQPEHDEEVDGRSRLAGALGRDEEEKGEQGPEGRRADDEGDAPPPARLAPITQVANQWIVERLDEAYQKKQDTDRRQFQQHRPVGIRWWGVKEDEPDVAALVQCFRAQPTGAIEELAAPRQRHPDADSASARARASLSGSAAPLVNASSKAVAPRCSRTSSISCR